MIKECGRILVFGHSNTWGAWDDEKHGWVTRLQLAAEEKYKWRHEVTNLGVSGNTSKDLLKRMELEAKARLTGSEVKRWYPRENNAIIVEIGGNDAGHVDNAVMVPLKKFVANLAKILKIAKKFVDQVAFLNCTTNIDSMTDPWISNISYKSAVTERYSMAIREFCKKHGTLLIDIHTPLSRSKTAVDPEDGLHLTAAGHKIIAEVVLDSLKKANYIRKLE